jgi:hypothetical protein
VTIIISASIVIIAAYILVLTSTERMAGVFSTFINIVAVSSSVETTSRRATGIDGTSIVVITLIRWFIEYTFTIYTAVYST